MKRTNIQLTPISIKDLYNHDGKSYNPSLWESSIDRYLKYKEVQFYIVPKGNGYDYERFFISYIIPDGLYIFAQWNAYHSSMSSNGFCKVSIDNDGYVCKELFIVNGGEGYAANTIANRKLLAQLPRNIMVSTNI